MFGLCFVGEDESRRSSDTGLSHGCLQFLPAKECLSCLNGVPRVNNGHHIGVTCSRKTTALRSPPSFLTGSNWSKTDFQASISLTGWVVMVYAAMIPPNIVVMVPSISILLIHLVQNSILAVRGYQDFESARQILQCNIA